MSEEKNNQTHENVVFDKSRILKSRNFSLSAEELEQHKNFIDTKIKDAIWNK